MIQEELLKEYMQLLQRAVEDQYRGTQEYGILMDRIDSGVPILGGDVDVQVIDPKTGKVSTIKYKVTVLDDLGNKIEDISDFGGRCTKGEFVHKNSIYKCLRCKRLFCEVHIDFVDHDVHRPLCCWGPKRRHGCYHRHERYYRKKYLKELTQTPPQRIHDIKALEKERDKTQLIKEIKQTEADIEDIGRRNEEKKNPETIIQPETKKPRRFSLSLSRFLSSNIRCPKCEASPIGGMIVSCHCGKSWRSNDGLNCPECGSNVNKVTCRCGNTISV